MFLRLTDMENTSLLERDILDCVSFYRNKKHAIALLEKAYIRTSILSHLRRLEASICASTEDILTKEI